LCLPCHDPKKDENNNGVGRDELERKDDGLEGTSRTFHSMKTNQRLMAFLVII